MPQRSGFLVNLDVHTLIYNSNMQSSAAFASDLSLRDLMRMLVERRLLIVGSAVAGIILAAIGSSLITPQWEATAVVQIGAIGQAKQVIEPTARVVERLKLRSFRDAVLSSITPPVSDSDAELYRRTLDVKILPSPDLIELSVRGLSKEKATLLMDATVSYLHRTHAQLAAPTVQRMKRLLARTKEEIAQIEAERDRMLDVASSISKKNAETRFMERVVLANVIIQRDAELRGLKQDQLNYEGLLDPLQTYPTSAIERTYASEGPVTPRTWLIIVLSGLAGVLVGTFVAFFSALSAQASNRDNEWGRGGTFS